MIDINTKVKKSWSWKKFRFIEAIDRAIKTANQEFNKITRFEYITDKGRRVVEYGEFEFQLQDDNKTLKVFKK